MRTFDDALEDHRIHCMVLQCLGEPLDGHKRHSDAQRLQLRTFGKQAARVLVTVAVSALAGGAFIEVADNEFIALRVGGSAHLKVPHSRVRAPDTTQLAQLAWEADAALAALI